MNLRSLFRTKKRMVALAASGAVLAAGAGIAVAVFGATGTAHSGGSVGTTSITVAATAHNPHGGPLYPGTAPSDQTLVFFAHNATTRKETLVAMAATATSTQGLVVTNGDAKAVAGCKATWFTARVSSVTPGSSVPGNGTATIRVTLAMKTVATTQIACQGHSPRVTLSVRAG